MSTRVLPDDADVPDAPGGHAGAGGPDDAEDEDPLAAPQRTRILPEEPDGLDDAAEAGGHGAYGDAGEPRAPAVSPVFGTRVLPEDVDLDAPMPEQPVGAIAPPPPESAGPVVAERYGIRFVTGDDDIVELLDGLARLARSDPAGTRLDFPETGSGSAFGGPAEATRADGPAGAAVAPGLLLVGEDHTGQRRLARLVARTLAEYGLSDGSVRLAHGAELRGAGLDEVAAKLDMPGQTLLLERFDIVLSGAADPDRMARAVRDLRRHQARDTSLIVTCPPDAFDRIAADQPELLGAFEVFRLPALADVESRMALLHVLADERRVTIGAPALEIVAADLERLSGPGDLVNARLVENYLERACARYYARVGTARDRLVLDPEDFSGLAEEIEPALRAPGDVDAYLDRLGRMIGLDEVKQTVDGLVAEARLAADRAAQGLPAGNASRNLIFVGARGTGKATVAGQLGGVYAALGLLDSGHVVACRPAHLTGRDRADTAAKVSLHVDQAMGGVLLVQGAERLASSPGTVDELLRFMAERRDKFMVVCAGSGAELDELLLTNPGFRAEFGAIVEFRGLSERELVQMFQQFAERDLYMLDEELRVELMARFGRMRDDPAFANAHTVREMFEETVARQAARLARTQVHAATAARLSVHDLPESALEEMLGGFRETPES